MSAILSFSELRSLISTRDDVHYASLGVWPDGVPYRIRLRPATIEADDRRIAREAFLARERNAGVKK